ncbi:MAG: hypothetical protein E5X23_02180 [Mesorhizobium sp.]|uniref:hypothetical protein n=2 Tax=Mesorhizobium TaxID=68287 RepID=UPI000FCAB159|nr:MULTISPECIES: hypothetical protein [unclassified Mesorhizobium]MCT2579144.1 hypothetical protein [Mesorhizobium sp. P13.3]MDF3168083.1 hypothetical protein [Mesorhizobium sp. P16.1]MDF3180009.1 hypothetical protein [Mesorhizobium sp. P17.1]MDF3184997.1 hypothetical protein [Mesorhizobium sp. ICCV3110.1]MDG4889622.1 hypothetical protein [Mesorhizobium sp. WSM4887]
MVRLAAYDYRELGKLLRAKLEEDGRGWRVCAADIGVSASDLSRICNGQSVSAPKVIAVCDWLKLSFRAFYLPPPRDAGAMFHGTSTETGSTCDAG